MKRERNEEDELLERIAKEMMKSGDVKTAFDVEEKLRKSFVKVIKSMLEAEMDQHLGNDKYKHEENKQENYRNGYSKKKVKSNLGEIELEVPRDRKSEFEPVVVPKHSTDISRLETQIIELYGMGNTTRQISDFVENLYGFGVSAEMVSNITDKIIPDMEEWKSRRLDEVYPFVFIDAIHFNVKTNGVVGKSAAYVVLGVNRTGIKEVLGIYIGESESSKFWLSVLNDIKNRGVKDILILSSDGLTGIQESIKVAYPKAEHQTCMVHFVRNTLKYVNYKDRAQFAQDLKTIYTASSEEIGKKIMYDVQNRWKERYPMAMNRWEENWSVICPFYKFSQRIRKMIYTTNSIESLNSGYRRLNKARNVYPSIQSLNKVLYLATRRITKNWTSKVPEWGECLKELEIMYDGRI
ncbi:MAG: IS256 family transposase [Clostridia bacterium]|nr:IS256 family transposase [Clostridia bacterium]